MNLAEKIGVNYCEFSVLLLEDDDGDQITAIEKEQVHQTSIVKFSDCG